MDNWQNFLDKVSWEGGMDMALDYGIDEDDVPEDAPEGFKDRFAAVVTAYQDYADLVRRLARDYSDLEEYI